ncbi:MAG: hypothetical protein AAGE01_18275, partial [Pseudomonadota bacterium]
DSEFRENIANGIGGTTARGGAIRHFNGAMTIERSSFIGNIAIADDAQSTVQSSGGAIDSSSSTLRISDSLFDTNSAEAGGAVRLSGATGGSTLERSIFRGNAAAFGGMAIYATGPGGNPNPEIAIHNTLFFDNEQVVGSTVGVLGASRIGLALRNNTFFDNRVGASGFAFLYTLDVIPISVVSHNVVQTPIGGATCRTQSGIPVPTVVSENIYAGGTCFEDDPTDQIETDLEFLQSLSVPIADDRMISVPVPLITSPVVDSGAPTASDADPAACLEEDLLGGPRPLSDGGTVACDAGVFEGGLDQELFSDGFEGVPIR